MGHGNAHVNSQHFVRTNDIYFESAGMFFENVNGGHLLTTDLATLNEVDREPVREGAVVLVGHAFLFQRPPSVRNCASLSRVGRRRFAASTATYTPLQI